MDGLYLHVPFCAQKCRYCDFLSFGHQSEERMRQYVQALEKEMLLLTQYSNDKPRTIFIGGGTPSFLPDFLLEKLLSAVRKYFVSPALVEFTIEGNPESLNEEKLQLLRAFGVNRLSIGVQSCSTESLQLLGRRHTFAEVVNIFAAARKAGFTNINFDLMYGLPGQDLSSWQQCLRRVLALGATHLSLYQLNIEERTLFGRWLREGKLTEFDDEMALAMYRLAKSMLTEAGFHQYEISNYAQDNFECEHNKIYWRTTMDYLGLGLGAHSFQDGRRSSNPVKWQDYVVPLLNNILPKREEETLTVKEAMAEMIFMGLRMNQGVSLVEFEQRFDKKLVSVYEKAITKCQKNDWLTLNEGYLRLTEKGRVLGNLVFVEFV